MSVCSGRGCRWRVAVARLGLLCELDRVLKFGSKEHTTQAAEKGPGWVPARSPMADRTRDGWTPVVFKVLFI